MRRPGGGSGHDEQMLHIRLVVPDDLRAAVSARLDGDATICNLTVAGGRVHRPSGALLLFDVPLEAANGLLQDLKALELHRRGSIALFRVDTMLSDAADLAEELAEGSPVEAVVWDEVADKVGQEVHFSASFAAFMVVAVLIGGVAVLTDSPVLVIGAMVVGPEFGPLAAAMLFLHRRRWREAGRAFATLLAGFGLAGAATVAFALVLRVTGQVPAGYSAGNQQFTAFISNPDVFSVLVALLAGVAGVLSLTEGRSGTLIGVLISVTTIPALADVAVSMALSNFDEMRGAALQLGVNLASLLLVGLVTLSVQEKLLQRVHRRAPAKTTVR